MTNRSSPKPAIPARIAAKTKDIKIRDHTLSHLSLIEDLYRGESGRGVGDERDRLLKTLSERLALSDSALFLLWLYDELSDKSTVWSTYPNTATFPSPYPIRISGHISDELCSRQNINYILTSFGVQWIDRYAWIIIPLHAYSHNRKDYIGSLQVLFPSENKDRVKKVFANGRCELIGYTLGARIAFGRKQRITDAVAAFQRQVVTAASVEQICAVGYKVLMEYASSNKVEFFINARNNLFSSIIPPTRQDIRSIYPETISDTDILGPNTCILRSSIEPGNQGELSRMVYVGRTRDQSGAAAIVPFMIIVLHCNVRTDFIGGTFSKTDEIIASAIGSYLSDILPSALLRQTIDHLSVESIKFKSETREHLGRMDFMKREKVYANLLIETLTGVKDVFIAESISEVVTPGHFVTRVRNVKGGTIESAEPFLWAAPARAAPKITASARPPLRTWLDVTISEIQSRRIGFRIFTHAPYIAEHEWRIIEYIISELRVDSLSESDVSERMFQIAEIRHALRSGLNGVLKHLKTAVGTYLTASTLIERGDEVSVLAAHAMIFRQAAFRKSMQRARHSGRQIDAFFEDTRLLLSDINKPSLQISQFRLDSAIDEICEIVLVDCQRRRTPISVIDNTSGLSRFVVGDITLISLALFNLIDNAVKYSFKDNSIMIFIQIKNRNISVTIQNIGPFIPEGSVREEIFQPFRRIAPSKGVQAKPGTGLGLASARKVAKVHEGDVKVDSTLISIADDERATTRFTFEIPRG